MTKDQIIIYQSEDGKTKLDVYIEGKTVWLTQAQISQLFKRDQSVISKHINNIFKEGELDKKSNMQNMHTTISDKPVALYNLDVIISVGYRVRSLRGTMFRTWATQRLKEYIIKGFTLDDERLVNGSNPVYFKELLDRIRAIRSSERNFYQKVTDIYATSIDYIKDAKLTQQFFATVQNKMHYAVHGHTAAEIIVKRADSTKPYMGMWSFKGKRINASDITTAKNYLSESEIKQLNLITSLYLDFAELQATNGRAMTMKDWITKLDEFLKISEKQVLNNTGKISAKKAGMIASKEYQLYRKAEDKNYISDFDKMIKKYLPKDLRKKQ